MVVYFPKNGKSVVVNGIQIKRPGLPMQFPVKVYEKFVEKGLLVRRPQDMDPISPEELRHQVEMAKEANKPVYVPESLSGESSGAPVPAGIGEDYPSATYKEEGADEFATNEYDLQLMAELRKLGVDTDKVLAEAKAQQKTETVVKESVEEKPVAEETHTGGVFASFVEKENKEETTGLTYEKALSMVKLNEDGSFKLGKDGTYVLTPGAKPYTKAEICAAIDKGKK